MRVDNNESFQEKKSLFKKYRFLIKKVGAKKRALCGTILSRDLAKSRDFRLEILPSRDDLSRENFISRFEISR